MDEGQGVGFLTGLSEKRKTDAPECPLGTQSSGELCPLVVIFEDFVHRYFRICVAKGASPISRKESVAALPARDAGSGCGLGGRGVPGTPAGTRPGQQPWQGEVEEGKMGICFLIS